MPRHLSSVSSVESEMPPDALYNYDVHEEIGRGATAIVYRAVCKRGRLRNRRVALKKILPSSATEGDETLDSAHLASSTGLHQALHHPSIVSLLSSFSTSTGHYHVLELCSRGTLSAFLLSRQPSVLSENELRGIVRTLVDALIYLRKERVVHRDLKPSNILLTENFRIKLSDFGLATQLSTMASKASTFCGSPNYVAPEIISRIPYGFAVDIWSLGCLMVTALSGMPAFEAPSVDQIFDKISCAKYRLPENVSSEARDLISGLLQIDPNDRIPLHRILSHPFFTPTFPVQPLSLSYSPRFSQQPRHTKTENTIPAFSNVKTYPQSLSKIPSGHADEAFGPLTRPRKPMADVVNLDLRNVLSNELPLGLRLPTPEWNRRILSAPPSGRGSNLDFLKPSSTVSTARMLSAPATPALTMAYGSPPSSRSITPGVENYDFALDTRRSLIRHPLLTVPNSLETDDLQSKTRGTSIPLAVKGRSFISASSVEDQGCTAASLSGSAERERPPSSNRSNPLRHYHPPPISAASAPSNRPVILTTSFLNPQTHKVSQGQLVILPSQSVLVDFREGERRKGGKGNEVVVISPDGMMINVYSAPHLSTPCCLAEPDATYSIEDLPATYCKSYGDAARLINQLKRRIPKLVLYKPEAKCTLMANEPHGDIEILIQPIDPPHDQSNCRTKDTGSITRPSMRVRLSRQRHSIDIARHIPSGTQGKSGGGEWTKKVLATAGGRFAITDEDWDSLALPEQAGMHHLADFLRVCESLEVLESNTCFPSGGLSKSREPATDVTPSNDDDQSDGRRRLADMLARIDQRAQVPPQLALSDCSPSAECAERDDGLYSTDATTASTKVLPSFSLPPRPGKFSSTSSRDSLGALRKNYTPGTSSLYLNKASSVPEPDTAFSRSDHTITPSAGTSQTRFLPSIGWCMRHEMGGTELYRIMFQDGASMAVDTGEGTVQFTTVWGETSRVPLHDSTRDAFGMERMKAFKKFVGLFAG